jgi:hypothetical protein
MILVKISLILETGMKANNKFADNEKVRVIGDVYLSRVIGYDPITGWYWIGEIKGHDRDGACYSPYELEKINVESSNSHPQRQGYSVHRYDD